MGFEVLNALMGFGLLAAGAPVIIHLLNRQRFKRVRFAAMHFLWAAKKKSNRILTFKELLLLLLRVLILLLLALALMRMVLGGTASLLSGRAKVYRVIILDNSYSMDLADGDKTLFERGKALALREVDSLKPGDECSLILMSDVAQAVMPTNSIQLQDVKRQIEDARLRPNGTNAVRALVLAHQLIKQNNSSCPQTEILLITDGTERAWKEPDGQLHPIGADEKALLRTMADPSQGGKHPLIVVFNLRPKTLPPTEPVYNLSVEGLSVDEALPAVGSTVNVRVRIRNRFDQASGRVGVTLFSDGKKYEKQEVESIKPVDDRVVQFRYLVPPGASHTLRALIQDEDSSRAGSSLAFDDQRFYSFDTIEKVNVLMVDGDYSTYIDKSDLGLFSVELDPPYSVDAQHKIFNVTHISDLQFADMRVDGFDAIVLADVGLIPPKKRVVLERYVADGGAVLIFPGEKTEFKLYNEELGKRRTAENASQDDIDILPAELLGGDGEKRHHDRYFEFNDKLGDHPMLMPIRNSSGIDLTQIHIYRRLLVKVPENNPNIDVVLRYSDHQPAIIERRVGRGRVMLVTTTANPDWNDMIPTSNGAILCYTMMGYLIQGTGAPRNLLPGDSIAIDLKQTEIAPTRQSPPVAKLLSDGFDTGEQFEVPLNLRLGGEPAPPAPGTATISNHPPGATGATGATGTTPPPPLASDESQVPTLVGPPLERVGSYATIIKGQTADAGPTQRTVYVSVNPVTAESDLTGIGNVDLEESWRDALYNSRVAPTDAAALKKRCELVVRNADDINNTKGDLLKAAGNLELRWLFLLIMLPALLVESFLAMYFGDYEGRFNQIMGHMWANVTGFFK
ncbi:MAG: VWA domain-containing protein [Planctomycetota bacterium]